jgi:purine-nucleoside phosphorylase
MTLAVIAGSGMGTLASLVRTDRVIPFAALDGVGACTVPGHAGEIRVGTIEGRGCLLVLGRRHLYEGDPGRVERLIDHVVALGASALLVTSAAGALHRSLRPGELVVVRDLIDRQSRAPTPRGGRAGAEARDTGGPTRLDPGLTAMLERAALAAGVAWQRGTLVCGSGPAYETPAEVVSLQYAGGDVATMSAAPEVAHARRCGLPAAALALVTNPCTGIESAAPSHREVLEAGGRAAGALAAVIRQFISLL